MGIKNSVMDIEDLSLIDNRIPITRKTPPNLESVSEIQDARELVGKPFLYLGASEGKIYLREAYDVLFEGGNFVSCKVKENSVSIPLEGNKEDWIFYSPN